MNCCCVTQVVCAGASPSNDALATATAGLRRSKFFRASYSTPAGTIGTPRPNLRRPSPSWKMPSMLASPSTLGIGLAFSVGRADATAKAAGGGPVIRDFSGEPMSSATLTASI